MEPAGQQGSGGQGSGGPRRGSAWAEPGGGGWAAAARGVPVTAVQGGHGAGRRGAQGSQAASGRAAALRPAACAGGE